MEGIRFMALGGAQSVGSSSYFLQLGNSNILLDCGTTRKTDIVGGPNLQLLLINRMLESFSQLDHVYISHAHSDHVGYLPDLLQLAPNASIYMTPMTKVLSSYRLDKNSKNTYGLSSIKKFANEKAFDNYIPVSYMQKINQGDYKVTFFPAGHIPGAMMTLFEYKKRRILYTGDYSKESMFGLDGYWLPDNLNVDTMIICALHAKNPWHKRKPNLMCSDAVCYMKKGLRVYFCVKDPSRMLEVLLGLNNAMKENKVNYPIYLEPEIMETIQMVEKINPALLDENTHLFTGLIPPEPHILIGTRPIGSYSGIYKTMVGQYTLHEDYDEMKSFIKKVNPRQAIMVHCAEGMSYPTIERELMEDADSKTQMIFPEVGEIYTL